MVDGVEIESGEERERFEFPFSKKRGERKWGRDPNPNLPAEDILTPSTSHHSPLPPPSSKPIKPFPSPYIFPLPPPPSKPEITKNPQTPKPNQTKPKKKNQKQKAG